VNQQTRPKSAICPAILPPSGEWCMQFSSSLMLPLIFIIQKTVARVGNIWALGIGKTLFCDMQC
jgi:hypothetical protein